MPQRLRFPWVELSLLCLLAVPALAVAPPYVGRAIATFQGERAVDILVSALAEARDLAQSRNRVVRVEIDPRAASVHVQGGRWRKLADGVVVAGPQTDGDGVAAFLFWPDGSSSGGQMVVSAQGRAWSLVVDPGNGHVRRLSGTLQGLQIHHH